MLRATAISVATGLTSARESARGEIRVLQGDAFDRIEELAPDSIDLVITSPPYWGHRTYGLEHNWDTLEQWRAEGNGADAIPSYDWYRRAGGVLGLEPLPDWYVAHLVEILDKTKRCLKARGSMWINVGDTYFARWASIRPRGRQGLAGAARERRRVPMGGYRQEKQLLLIPARFAIAMQECRWILRNDLIWYKPNVAPRPEADRLRLAHEHFFHFVKRPTQGRASYFYDLSKVEARATDVVVENARAGEAGHSATFPESVIGPRILSSCPAQGTVLDPFCGTGTSLEVAARHGRSAVGIELAKQFVEATRKRARKGKR